MAGGRRPTYRCDSSIVEEIRAADARGRHADKRIGRFDDGWIGARFVSYVARPVQYGALQVFGQPLGRGAVISTFKAMTLKFRWSGGASCGIKMNGTRFLSSLRVPSFVLSHCRVMPDLLCLASV